MPVSDRSRALDVRSLRIAAAPIALALVVGLGGCSTSASATNDQQTNYVALNGVGVVTVYAVGHRKLAPPVTGSDLGGHPLTLSQFAGKVIVLNFWASWCPPCRSEAAALEQVYTDTRTSGVQFVGVDIRENGVSDGVHFETTHRIDYPSFSDQASHIALDFRSTGVQSPPTTIIIDRQGRIAARGLGEMTYPQLLSVVQQVAAQGSA
jgi:thiol-disulfide isomerase/thioredoxin